MSSHLFTVLLCFFVVMRRLDPGSSNSAYYELQGVLTHQGRSSSSGHYVGWIKMKGPDASKPKTWYKMDDDKVSPVDEEEILKLSGGGNPLSTNDFQRLLSNLRQWILKLCVCFVSR
jgi:hypothetical protein